MPELVTNLFYAGQEVATTSHREIYNPFSKKLVGLAANASELQVEQAILVAANAQQNWASLTLNQRAAELASALEKLPQNEHQIAKLLTQEVGKILHESEIDLMVFKVRYNLALSNVNFLEQIEQLPKDAYFGQTQVQRQALGVVTIIVPFNWPLAILAASLPSALLAGNTVIVKPPASAPLATTQFVSQLAALLPAGVLNVITGSDENLKQLIQHPKIAKVCFTGSVAVGKKMMQLAAENLTRLTLELGGNDPAIILEDAILDDVAVDRLSAACFDSAGQICMNVKRIYVHESRIDELVAKLSKRIEGFRLGDPIDSSTTLGPLHSAAAASFANSLIESARDSAIRIIQFNHELPNENFVQPTLIIDPAPDSPIVQQEQFAPVIPIMRFSNIEDAIERANDNWAGLSASVWSSSPERAHFVAGNLKVGYVWINDHGAANLDLRAPFGGMKHSGFGREQGIAGLLDFTDTRAISKKF